MSQITKLKIDSNPFAKGFRDSSRLSEFERETMESMLECQLMRQGAGPVQHQPRPLLPPALPPLASMFRARLAGADTAPKFSQEERAVLMARSHLLRGQTPPSPFHPQPGLGSLRPSLPPPLGLQTLWAQMAQLHQLNSALLAQSHQHSAASIFSSLLSEAHQRVSPYVISSPSPPSQSRSPSPVQVES